MNAERLIEQFRILARDTVEPYLWDEDMVLFWLNEAEREAADRARLIFDASTSEITHVGVAAGDPVCTVNPLVIEIATAFLDDSGRQKRLKAYDRTEMDRLFPDWRTITDIPSGYIFEGSTLTLNRIPSKACSITLEVYRFPLEDFTTGEPEIPPVHHSDLVPWALHRAFSIPDSDGNNNPLSGKYLTQFERYFGRKGDANKRRRQRENTPHVNKCHW